MTQAALFAPATSRVLVLICGLAAAAPSHAISGAGIELGMGDDSTRMARITARWDWDKRWSIGQNWIASGFWEAGLGRWQGDGAGKQDIWDLGITPVFRLRSGISPFYLEGAIGAHFLSKTRINNGRAFGCSFNFGDHVGFGWNFGDKDHYELGYRFQHLSNADLATPNNGINFHQLRFGYNY
jgi:hypothetical protein